MARQEALRDMRLAMEAERNKLVASLAPPSQQEEEEGGQLQRSEVRSWAELRAKHQRERAALARKFREEHDWCVP